MGTGEHGKPGKQAASVKAVKEHVAIDKDLGEQASRKAEREKLTYSPIAVLPDITGKPEFAKQQSQYIKEQYRAFEAIIRRPFYRRVNARIDFGGDEEDVIILISEARVSAGGMVHGSGWILVSYTSTLATQIEGKPPGSKVIIQVPKRRPVHYDVGESSKYELLLPRFENAHFMLKSGEAAFANEAELDALELEVVPVATPAELPAKAYEAKPTFGLDDIIVLRDEPQIAAMGLPFGESVVIEGPPGSGKTSIGILRLATMYDRQWEELGLDRQKDLPFHDYSTMQVLVYNPEMVEYLKGLAQSIGVHKVDVKTTYDFFREICGKTKLITGTARKDRISLAALKGRREVLRAFFAGFQVHAARSWDSRREDFRRSLFALAPDFLVLADRMDTWIKWVKQAKVEGEQIVGAINLTDPLTDAVTDILREKSPTRNALSHAGNLGRNPLRSMKEGELRKHLSEARELTFEVIRTACSRAGATRAMFQLAEYVELKTSALNAGMTPTAVEDADRLWRRQYKGTLPAYSELDLAMSAWLGARLLLTSRTTGPKPWLGGRLDRLTHIVVDEVQDLSPNHLGILGSQLAPQGTMTLVGDVHQNLNPLAGLRRWEDINLPNTRRTAFGVNYRQTEQLGRFIKAMHSELFQEECAWRPSKRLTGEIPRFGYARSWPAIARAVATEARYWRSTIEGKAGATVAVLYDGRIEPKRLKMLRKRVEEALADDLVRVEIATSKTGSEVLRRTNQVVIASVRQTKGLEFDAVIFIEPKPRWSKPVVKMDLRVRNGFYVATSRARAGLSLCMSNLPECVDHLAARELCSHIEWHGESGT